MATQFRRLQECGSQFSWRLPHGCCIFATCSTPGSRDVSLRLNIFILLLDPRKEPQSVFHRFHRLSQIQRKRKEESFCSLESVGTRTLLHSLSEQQRPHLLDSAIFPCTICVNLRNLWIKPSLFILRIPLSLRLCCPYAALRKTNAGHSFFTKQLAANCCSKVGGHLRCAIPPPLHSSTEPRA